LFFIKRYTREKKTKVDTSHGVKSIAPAC